jgi:hypothetical protein
MVAEADKKKFETARTSFESLYADIVKQVGAPDKVEWDNSCGYGSREFERGPLSCGSSIVFAYPVNDNVEASNMAEKINAAIDNRQDIFMLKFSNRGYTIPFVQIVDQNDARETDSDYTFMGHSELHCSSSMKYINSSNPSASLTSTKQEHNLVAELSCGGEASSPHYKVTKTS